ncbi:hypothetical protein BD309DRAFT_944752 [Dichomitus squalens]|nr:hypothetical protein BD309DRAFT_944752 [Dichomitus squalens]
MFPALPISLLLHVRYLSTSHYFHLLHIVFFSLASACLCCFTGTVPRSLITQLVCIPRAGALYYGSSMSRIIHRRSCSLHFTIPFPCAPSLITHLRPEYFTVFALGQSLPCSLSSLSSVVPP